MEIRSILWIIDKFTITNEFTDLIYVFIDLSINSLIDNTLTTSSEFIDIT